MSSTTILQSTLPRYRPTRPRPYSTGRHRPGDTFLIGVKPHDTADPGPWLWKADPAYRPDRRTGRHRRGELPDPVPQSVHEPRPNPLTALIARIDRAAARMMRRLNPCPD